MRTHSVLKIYTEKIKNNLEKIHSLIKNRKIILMVKANAYGHGLAEIASYLEESLTDSFDRFGVASFEEALYLRRTCDLTKKDIFVFSEFDLSSQDVRDQCLSYNIIPVISSMSDLKIFLEDRDFKHFPLVLKLNTGMNRLGINKDELVELKSLMKSSQREEINHLMTHFSCSYLENHPTTKLQLDLYEELYKDLSLDFKILESSVSNSGAIEQKILGANTTHVRPGLMFYGPQSTFSKKKYWEGELISEFETEVISKRALMKSDPVGYGATPLSDDGVIAHLPIGYGDGIPLSFQGANIKWGDQEAFFIGRVNMDISSLYFKSSNIIKRASIWSTTENYMELVKHSRSNPYTLFTNLSARLPRKLIYN